MNQILCYSPKQILRLGFSNTYDILFVVNLEVQRTSIMCSSWILFNANTNFICILLKYFLTKVNSVMDYAKYKFRSSCFIIVTKHTQIILSFLNLENTGKQFVSKLKKGEWLILPWVQSLILSILLFHLHYNFHLLQVIITEISGNYVNV